MQIEALYKRLKCAIALIKLLKSYITNENLKQSISHSLSPTFYVAYRYGEEFLNVEWTKYLGYKKVRENSFWKFRTVYRSIQYLYKGTTLWRSSFVVTVLHQHA